MLTKTSICLFLLRIVDSRKIKIAIYALIGCLITFTTVCVCLFLGVCRPLKAYWDVGVDGVCLSDHQLESVVLVQGSKVESPLTICAVANATSTFHHFRSYMCGLSDFVPAESSDQNADKGGFVCLDGPRCDVRQIKSQGYEISSCVAYNWYSTAACCTVRTVLSGAVTDPDITCQYRPMTPMGLD